MVPHIRSDNPRNVFEIASQMSSSNMGGGGTSTASTGGVQKVPIVYPRDFLMHGM